MRVKIREVVDTDSPLNISKLSTLNKLIVTIQYLYKNTKLYKFKKEERQEREYRLQVAQEERLKETILAYIYGELIRNNKLSERGLVCNGIVLAIDRKLESSVRRVIKHKDFISFDIQILDCDHDMLRSFKDLKILVEIKSKALGG